MTSAACRMWLEALAPILKPLTKIINARRPASGTIALPSMPKRSESCLLLVFTIRSLTGGSFGHSKPSLNGMFHVCLYPLFQAKQYHLNLAWWAPTEYAGSTIQSWSYASCASQIINHCFIWWCRRYDWCALELQQRMCSVSVQRSDVQNTNASTTGCLMWWHLLRIVVTETMWSENIISWWWICCTYHIINHCWIWWYRRRDWCALEPEHMCLGSGTVLRCAKHQCKHKWVCWSNIISCWWNMMRIIFHQQPLCLTRHTSLVTNVNWK